MTNTERLMLKAHAVQIELLRSIAKALGAYHDDLSLLVQEQLEATVDSMTADEADAQVPK